VASLRRAWRLGVGTFRTLNGPLFGEMHVRSGRLLCKGARKSNRGAKDASPNILAGFDDGSGSSGDGSVAPSGPRVPDRKRFADLAGGDGDEARRAPECSRTRLALPEDASEFVDQVNELEQFVRVAAFLLSDEQKDVKTKQQLLKQLLELKYGKNARRVFEEEYSATDCVPRPVRE